jgi:hypothetical protein
MVQTDAIVSARRGVEGARRLVTHGDVPPYAGPGALHAPPGHLRPGAYTVVPIGRALEKLDVVLDPNHGPAVARKDNDRKHPEHGVDGAALEPQVT